MIFPSRKLALKSPFPPADTARLLQGAVRPRRGWWSQVWSRGAGNFMGEVTENSFDIVRDIPGRNSFLPNVRGTIVSDIVGSRINVYMKMHASTTGFMAIWLFFTVFGLLDAGRVWYGAWKAGKHMDPHFCIIIGSMAVFGFLLMHFSFRPEAKRAENFLKETLKAEVDPSTGRDRAL
ncbi:MAG: hypothetical protein EPN97_03175 [Alphaproteobacteria bacterium]|nr:MAG: hypothetical protein EPN97_03175 [Alphaproteobacteria bacterium]